MSGGSSSFQKTSSARSALRYVEIRLFDFQVREEKTYFCCGITICSKRTYLCHSMSMWHYVLIERWGKGPLWVLESSRKPLNCGLQMLQLSLRYSSQTHEESIDIRWSACCLMFYDIWEVKCLIFSEYLNSIHLDTYLEWSQQHRGFDWTVSAEHVEPNLCAKCVYVNDRMHSYIIYVICILYVYIIIHLIIYISKSALAGWAVHAGEQTQAAWLFTNQCSEAGWPQLTTPGWPRPWNFPAGRYIIKEGEAHGNLGSN